MDRITVREAYGPKLTLGIDAQIPLDILEMDEYDIPTWGEIGKIRAYVDELLAKPVPYFLNEDSSVWLARSRAVTAEAQSVMSAAEHYAKLRRRRPGG